MELQRLDDITKDLCKLYGEFCCELADRAKTDDMATLCALAKINDALMDAIGGVRGLGFIEMAKKLADEREKNQCSDGTT